MNITRTGKIAGRLAAACVLTGAVMATGAAGAGAATVPAHTGTPTTMTVPEHGPHGGGGHSGGGQWRGGGGGHRGGGGYNRGGGGYYRGGGGYYGPNYYDGCDPYYYGYYDLDNPTCE
ncbi:MAG TPA: hypothetical protein VHV82_22345 [Sporichthyaceae bacterium]|jgi:hypothetical protein|nr:hypothetical protein [Sporichthyaceae bacterium]